MLTDLRFACRALWRTPSFTLLAVLTMGVAIGACSALFSALHAVVLRPLPYPKPDSLVSIWLINPEKKAEIVALSWAKYEIYREAKDVFADFAMSGNANFTLTEGNGDPEQVAGLYVTANFLPVLGLALERGRNFLPEEDRAGGPDVAIISHALWQNRFAGDANILGATVLFDGTPRQVIGVLPRKMPAPYSAVSVLVPRPLELPYLNPQQRISSISHQAVARLAPGVTLAQAQSRLHELQQRFKAENPSHIDAQNQNEVRTLTQQVIGNVGRTFWLLAAAVGAVFLIACSNIANLFLARISAREREIAIRMSLGARRGMIIRQFLLESFLFSSVASVLGLTIAAWAVRGIQILAGPQLPRGEEIALNDAALLTAVVAALLASFAIGLYPALQASRTHVGAALKDGGRGLAGSVGSRRFRNGLVIAQLAMSLVLLVCSGLLVRTFGNLQSTELGYAVEGRAVGSISLPASRYPTPDSTRDFFTRLQEKLRQAPELAGGGAVTGAPLAGNPFFTPYAVAGRPLPPAHERGISAIRMVTPDYFTTLGMVIRQGRAFTDADRPDSEPVAVINETLARKLFPNQSALDQKLILGSAAGTPPLRIVGILGDVRSASIGEPPADEIYIPRQQRGGSTMHVVGQARPGLDAAAVLPVLRRLVAELDPNLALGSPQTMPALAKGALGIQRVTMALLLVFAAIANLLATVGVYSVMAYTVTLRRREIAVRVALGANRRDILGTVLRGAFGQIAAGVGLGLAGAFFATRLLESTLYQVAPLDPAVFGYSVLLFLVASLAACLLPARRSLSVDPISALRAE